MSKYIEVLKLRLKHNMDIERYNHSIGVAYTAACLAMRYNYDIKKAEIAGLLHDCAKGLPNDEKIKLCMSNDITINKAEAICPDLLHAKLGAFLAEKYYNVIDEEILKAILCHTTGRPKMSLLDKILYIADYIEPNRDKFENLEEIRRLAFIDIDKCLFKILFNTTHHLVNKNKMIDPITIETYQYYEEEYQSKQLEVVK